MNNIIPKGKSRLLTILVGLLVFVTTFPIFDTIGYSVIMGIIIVLCFFMFPGVLSNKPARYMLLFFSIEAFYALIGKGLSFRTVVYQTLQFLAAMVVCFHIKDLNKKQINILLYFVIGSFLFTMIVTYMALLSDNMIIRNFGYGGSDNSTGTYVRGVYSYGFGEALSIILPAMTFFALSTKRRILQLLLFFLIAAGLITQFMASLTTSALLSSIFCVVTFLSSATLARKQRNIIISIIILGIVSVFVIPSLNFDENLTFLMKMEDVNHSYATGQSTGQVQDRTVLYRQSLRVYAQNPIFGMGEVPDDFGKYTRKTVSLHTTIFDYLGLYGLFVILFFISWKETIKQTYYVLPMDRRKNYRWVYFSLVLLLLLKGPVTIGTNFIFSTVLLAIFFMSDYHYNPIVVKNEA